MGILSSLSNSVDAMTILFILALLAFIIYEIESRLPKGTPINQFHYHAITFDNDSINIMPFIAIVGLIFFGYILIKKVNV